MQSKLLLGGDRDVLPDTASADSHLDGQTVRALRERAAATDMDCTGGLS